MYERRLSALETILLTAVAQLRGGSAAHHPEYQQTQQQHQFQQEQQHQQDEQQIQLHQQLAGNTSEQQEEESAKAEVTHWERLAIVHALLLFAAITLGVFTTYTLLAFAPPTPSVLQHLSGAAQQQATTPSAVHSPSLTYSPLLSDYNSLQPSICPRLP
jgi:uncharacterized membrane protein YdbT with pleckstrin-like domain